MPMHDRQPFACERDLASPSQAGRPQFLGNGFEIRNRVRIVIAEAEVERHLCADSDNLRAVEIPAMDQGFCACFQKKLHGAAGAAKFIVKADGNIGSANIDTGSLPANPPHRLPICDAAGTLYGYVAVYPIND